jgi:hypothetical protein
MSSRIVPDNRAGQVGRTEAKQAKMRLSTLTFYFSRLGGRLRCSGHRRGSVVLLDPYLWMVAIYMEVNSSPTTIKTREPHLKTR